MEKGIEKGLVKGREEGMEKGAYLQKIEIAKEMFRKNMTIDLISEITGLPVSELETLLKKSLE